MNKGTSRGAEKIRSLATLQATDPDSPKVYRRGELAEAEPAVPGWTMPVEDLFR